MLRHTPIIDRLRRILPIAISSETLVRLVSRLCSCGRMRSKLGLQSEVIVESWVHHGRTTSRNGQASRRRHCCASRVTEVGGQSSHRMHLLEYLNDAWASRVLVSYLYSTKSKSTFASVGDAISSLALQTLTDVGTDGVNTVSSEA